jgi:hypothetical protein
MGWRIGLLSVSSALLLAGCGDAHKASPPPAQPRIPAGVAARLAAEADRVAALTPGTCEARDAAVRFRSDVIASIGSVPARYQEPLSSAANSLAERLSSCVPPAPQKRRHEKNRHDKKPHRHEHDGND